MHRIIIFASLLLPFLANAQDSGTFTGSLEANYNVFIRDTAIGAADIPQYDNQLSGGELWLNLNYNYQGLDVAMRFDAFYNSNLQNPTGSYTAQGIGYWHIRKKIKKLDVTVGHIYDQIGAGIIFRSYEARPLFIDNALIGLRLNYDLVDKDDFSLVAKAMMGRQRLPFQNNGQEVVPRAYRQSIRAISFDGFLGLGDVNLAPGWGFTNRTLDDNSMNLIVAGIQDYGPQDAFIPKYNVYATSLYNTLTYKNFSWYVEGAYKTEEAVVPVPEQDPPIRQRNGNLIYTSLSYSKKGFGANVEFKRTQDFTLRVSPFEELNNGLMNFMPPMARQNTYRLTARYNAATQEFGELAFLGDVRYSPMRRLTFNAFGSWIDDLDDEPLFREAHLNVRYRKPREYSLVAGGQYLFYNQRRFEQKEEGTPNVKAWVPYFDFQYKFNRKQALRMECQYMFTDEDFGQWAFALLEYSFAPHWIITASDMVNTNPSQKTIEDRGSDRIIHYPTFGVVYATGPSRFNLSYVKQVEGVVCTGGICRLEPAFSGVKLNVTTSF